VVLDKFLSGIKQNLDDLDNTLRRIASLPFIQVSGLDDSMLARATPLALAEFAAKPFDHAILANVLVRAERLWDEGKRDISFCEEDSLTIFSRGTDTETLNRAENGVRQGSCVGVWRLYA